MKQPIWLTRLLVFDPELHVNHALTVIKICTYQVFGAVAGEATRNSFVLLIDLIVTRLLSPILDPFVFEFFECIEELDL